MEKFSKELQIRWSDLDPNFHLRHSVYYDWGALIRIDFLNRYGLTAGLMAKIRFGPILFREECVFKREIHLEDQVSVDLVLLRSRRDYSRWTILHTFRKGGDTVAAVLTCDGAWLDTVHRKLAVPPPEVTHVFEKMPLASEFQWTD